LIEQILPQGELLYVSYCPPYVNEGGTADRQPIVTALFRESTEAGEAGYTIREYSLKKGEMFYRFPKEGAHWSRAAIREEWYRDTEERLPRDIFEGL
jgi:hypothetical protein